MYTENCSAEEITVVESAIIEKYSDFFLLIAQVPAINLMTLFLIFHSELSQLFFCCIQYLKHGTPIHLSSNKEIKLPSLLE